MDNKEGITVETINERQVEWTPKGCGSSSRKLAIIRDGKIDELLQIDSYLINADIDGYIEFIQAVKQAMIDTKKNTSGGLEKNG